MEINMRIGIDMRPFVRAGTGIPRVLRQTLKELAIIDQANSYYLYSDRDFDSPFPQIRWHKRFRNWFPFLPGTAWLYTNAKQLIAEDQPDLFWGPGGYLPPGLPKLVARVITVHDVVWKRYPETLGRFNRLTNLLLLNRSIREATVLVAVSKSTAWDIRSLFGVPDSKIRVVYNGIGLEYHPYPREISARFISEKYHVSQDYILTVGTIEPRKNLVTLLEAFKILREEFGLRKQLVIAGAKGWKSSPIYESLNKLGFKSGEVVFPGYIDEDDLPKAYSGAKVYVISSLYEGFGLPLLEAMACGTPVVSSDAAALLEVGGGATISVPAQEACLLAKAISRVTTDEKLKEEMIERGYVRARQFSWQQSAKQMIDVFEEAYTQIRK